MKLLLIAMLGLSPAQDPQPKQADDFCPQAELVPGFQITCEDDYSCKWTIKHLDDGLCWWDYIETTV
jgi:hypothetical protein